MYWLSRSSQVGLTWMKNYPAYSINQEVKLEAGLNFLHLAFSRHVLLSNLCSIPSGKFYVSRSIHPSVALMQTSSAQFAWASQNILTHNSDTTHKRNLSGMHKSFCLRSSTSSSVFLCLQREGRTESADWSAGRHQGRVQGTTQTR